MGNVEACLDYFIDYCKRKHVPQLSISSMEKATTIKNESTSPKTNLRVSTSFKLSKKISDETNGTSSTEQDIRNIEISPVKTSPEEDEVNNQTNQLRQQKVDGESNLIDH